MWHNTKNETIFKATYPGIPLRMRLWDQFYLWWLINKHDHGLNIQFFEEDARWNFVVGYLEEELGGKPAIIRHYTLEI